MKTNHLIHYCWTLPALAAAIYVAPTPATEQAQNCGSQFVSHEVLAGNKLAEEFDILSWNIQKASNNGWASDLAQHGAGVALAFIQEASLQARLADVIPGPYQAAFAAGYSTGQNNTGVMTLSAGGHSGHCRLTAREPWLGTPKAANITMHPLRDSEYQLLAINLHAVNFELGLASFQSQFGALRDVLAQHEGPVIFAGDLNTWSGERQSMVDSFMSEYGLASVSFEPDLRTQAFGHALDHIYVRGLSARQAEVIPVSSSDHNPLRVRLAVQ